MERVRRYNPRADEDVLNRAYVFAMKAHGSQKRASGDPYFSHPLEVAAILTELKVDDATIVAAMLHDTIEDTTVTREEVDKAFGEEIGGLVDGLTKLGKLDFVTKHAEQAENFRKLLLAIADDARVLLVKLADRLHNMRTLQFMPADKRARIAEDTLDIYAPLAGRMGMQSMRNELEDLAFRCLMPDAYQLIVTRLEAMKSKNGAIIARIAAELTDQFARRGIKVEVKGRQKQPYSIWRKMERRSIAFEQLSDIYGFRILVDTVADCYAAVGVAHTTWPSVPGRFKDYISTPKQNDYRSIHTTVIGPGSQRVELEIRTHEMHEVAEYGIAAHSAYKDTGLSADAPTVSETRAYRGLRQTIEALASDDPAGSAITPSSSCFTTRCSASPPKGGSSRSRAARPRSTSPMRCTPMSAIRRSGARSMAGSRRSSPNCTTATKCRFRAPREVRRRRRGKRGGHGLRPGRHSPRDARGGKGPIRRPRARDRRARVRARGQEVRRGEAKASLPRLARASIDDVFVGVGRGEIFSTDVVRAVFPNFKEERRSGPAISHNESGWFGLPRAADLVFRVPGESDAGSLPLRGIDLDTPVKFAPKGGAVPGERIVGVREEDGIAIHPIHSPALTKFDDRPELWLDVRWDLENAAAALYSTQIVVTLLNEPGALGVIATTIGENGANIDSVATSPSGADFRRFVIDLQVRDIQHLNAVLSQLRDKSVVHKVDRLSG